MGNLFHSSDVFYVHVIRFKRFFIASFADVRDWLETEFGITLLANNTLDKST